MKKFALTLLCASIAAPALAGGSSYVTGNVQMHDRADFNGSDVTSTIEAGHTFTTGTTVLVEIDGIQLGNTNYGANGEQGSSAASAYTTLGVEQSFSINENLWVAAGYHHLLHDGEAVQYRPLVKIGYNFDNGLSISNRTRMQIQANDTIDAGVDVTNDQVRLDNNIAYQFKDMPVNVKYNNVYYVNDGVNNDNSMEHELRATWTRAGVQPYVEYRNQESSAKTNPGHNNNVLVVGASYGF
ncbi:oligogalacturonate-specific porin KdgM family protein [Moritella sp. Urea-trap-13]|uniref:oligogalacturonate-specific porin KdgM family protein n=1 Tax=Moritella sp. Urea-trap-13 TaxID=2058327 RepID=UPI000C342DD4|nr:oligogalacturonate-specific porin KdgM family protein [Moritella sp. Urea-trap-13]PKH05633.1 porin [Moritella sp. Urea-trap-13]